MVGGFDKVFEINRSFRNEGLSTKHNPEFTMLEFYAAHEKFDHTLNFVSDIIKNATDCVGLDLAKVEWDGDSIDLNNFDTKTMRELVLENNSELRIVFKHQLTHGFGIKVIKINAVPIPFHFC